jgi:UDP-N-acetylmuramate dehydrogenase
LSLIPGTVGASPIQNIGAYGQEAKNSILNVQVYEFETGKFYEIANSECDFSYRDSIFKKNIGKFAIVNVGFSLSKKEPKMPTYKDLSLYFLAQQTKDPSLKKIRQAVIEIRRQKLPDWQKEPNCGSFFKNPIIDNELAKEMMEKYPSLPQYNAGAGKTKISGGWLIEKAGFKGKSFDGIKVHNKSALVLINSKNGSFKKLEKAIKIITDGVKNKFDIDLEIEPNLIK